MRSILFLTAYALTAEAARFQRSSMSIDPSASAPPPKPSGDMFGGRHHGHGKNNSTFPGPPPNGTQPFDPSHFNSTQGGPPGPPPNGHRGPGASNIMQDQVIKPSGKPHSKRDARNHKAHSVVASKPSGKPHSKRDANADNMPAPPAGTPPAGSPPSGAPPAGTPPAGTPPAMPTGDFPERPEPSARFGGGPGGKGGPPPPAPSS